MPLNVNKCKVMHVGKTNPVIQYEIIGEKIPETIEEKDLGVFISNNLKVGTQCCKVAKKGNQILGLIERTFTSRDKDIMLKLYKSLVRPHLDYCVQVWCPFL